MAEGLTIRDATRADLPAIADIYEAAGIDRPGSNAPTIEQAWQRLRSEVPSARVLLAVRDEVPVGTLTCFVLPLLSHRGAPGALVESVAVHPRAQGRGIGRALMDAAMRLARDEGCYKLALSSNLKRTAAHAFYERLGYAPHGVSFVVPAGEAGA